MKNILHLCMLETILMLTLVSFIQNGQKVMQSVTLILALWHLFCLTVGFHKSYLMRNFSFNNLFVLQAETDSLFWHCGSDNLI
jgi:hypothetical protein